MSKVPESPAISRSRCTRTSCLNGYQWSLAASSSGRLLDHRPLLLVRPTPARRPPASRVPRTSSTCARRMRCRYSRLDSTVIGLRAPAAVLRPPACSRPRLRGSEVGSRASGFGRFAQPSRPLRTATSLRGGRHLSDADVPMTRVSLVACRNLAMEEGAYGSGRSAQVLSDDLQSQLPASLYSTARGVRNGPPCRRAECAGSRRGT